MRLLLVHNAYRSGSPGGEDQVFEQELALLRSAGHEVVTYTRSNDEMDEGSLRDQFVVLAGMQRSRRTTAELGDVLDQTSPDIVHFHNTFPLISLSAYQVCRQRRVPIVQTIHNFRMVCAVGTHYRKGSSCEKCRPGSPWSAVRHRCYRDSAAASLAVAAMISRNHFSGATRRWVDRYVVLGSFARDRLLAVGINPERISIKPNFVKETSFSWCSVDARQDKRPYALFVGRLSPEKALLDLLRAWVLVRHIPLRVAGTGPELNYARQLVRELNLEVEFLGYLSRKEVLEQMANARCVVVSDGCYEAGIPLVVIESWAVGAPVVAPRTGSMGSLVDRVDSVIFNDFSGNTFHQAISAVWTDTELRQRVSVGGRDRWQRDHSPEVSLASLISIYQSLRSVS